LDAAVSQADIVIVIDFGHGLITEKCREVLGTSKFLALNAQSNAGNHGFNPVTKYRRADYVCVDNQEARLAVQCQHEGLETVLERLSARMGTERVIITQGRSGAVWLGGNVPAIAERPVDTIGAGDCFLSLTAPLIAYGLGLPAAAFVGAVAAGMKTEIIGHRESVQAEIVLQTVRSLLQ
jgi:sugar/nucleoside kinase (ribokinase family)